MKEIRIYKISLANFLTSKGFVILRTVQDAKNINRINWIFEETPELKAAIAEYIQAMPKK